MRSSGRREPCVHSEAHHASGDAYQIPVCSSSSTTSMKPEASSNPPSTPGSRISGYHLQRGSVERENAKPPTPLGRSNWRTLRRPLFRIRGARRASRTTQFLLSSLA